MSCFFVESPAFSEKMSCFYNNPSGKPTHTTAGTVCFQNGRWGSYKMYLQTYILAFRNSFPDCLRLVGDIEILS